MAAEVRTFAVSVPAGTPQAAPQLSDMAMPARIVTSVRVRVPPGPAGQLGWALAAAGVPILPWNTGAWMVMDGEAIDWPLTDQIDSGAWQLRAYNTGTYPHVVYVTFQLEIAGSARGGSPLAPLVITP